MSKYIIDLRPDCKVVQQICASNENVNVGARSIGLLDELTDDYVKENFKDLLEGEYQRGLEHGKKEAESSEAIERAKADAFNNGMLHKGEKIHEAYQRGLNDAWECGKKLAWTAKYGGYGERLNDVFGRDDTFDFYDYTPNEAIEKLKSFEQKQEGKIEVGDTVNIKDTSRSDGDGIVTKIWNNLLYIMWNDGSSGTWDKEEVVKTGRHFDIEKILEAMKHD